MTYPLPWTQAGAQSIPMPKPVGPVPVLAHGLSSQLDRAIANAQEADQTLAQASRDLADGRPGGGSFADACLAGPKALAQLLQTDTERWAHCLVAAQTVDVTQASLRYAATKDTVAREKLTEKAAELAGQVLASHQDLRDRARELPASKVERELEELDQAAEEWRHAVAALAWLDTGRLPSLRGHYPDGTSKLRLEISSAAELVAARSS